MRRLVPTLCVGVGVAILLLASPAVAQQEEEETGQLGPGDSTPPTTLAEEPVDPGEVVVVDPTAETTPTQPTVATTTTLPAGCAPPLPPQAVFTGTVVDYDSRTARFTIDDVLSGSLEGWRVDALVDVDFFDDTRFLERDQQYLVAAEVNLDDGRLRSKVKPVARLFGGDQVVGVDDPNVVCPEQDDPVITRMIDGTSVETGLLNPLLTEERDIVWAFVKPALIVLAVLVGLVVIKRAAVGAGHVVGRLWRSRSGPPQAENAAAANVRSSSTA